jgi:hypothetical protein
MNTPQSRIEDHFILIYKPEHHRAFPVGYVPEHYLVAEESLGRPLSDDEDVKHINGDTRDNDPKNLKVVSGSYKILALDGADTGHKPSKTFVSCRFQKSCWEKIRGPIARKNKIFLPYVCSYQSEGDIYFCGNYWTFREGELRDSE